jgi:glycosyltransferase involved in cell wall biosynthesis
MSAGVPVVFTSNPPGPEMIEDGVNGLLADPASGHDFAEKTSRVLDNPDLAAGLATRARKRVAGRFSLDKCLEATEHFYEECLRERHQASAANYLPRTLPAPLPHRH